MNIFANNKTEKEFNDFTEKIENIIFELEEFGSESDIKDLKTLIANFKIKTNDFLKKTAN